LAKEKMMNLNDEQILGVGSVLLDEGYGSFERCYNVSRAVRGNLRRQGNILANSCSMSVNEINQINLTF